MPEQDTITIVRSNGESRGEDVWGGEGGNSAFPNPLLRIGVTHHHKQWPMTEISSALC